MPTDGPGQNRRLKAAKNLMETASSRSEVKRNREAIQKQYRLIRHDILKLRADLAHGYDLVKEMVETKINRRTLVKGK